MKKKLFSLLSVLLILVLIFASCTKDTEETETTSENETASAADTSDIAEVTTSFELNKDKTDSTKFSEAFEKAGFTVTDDTATFEGNDITKVLNAVNENDSAVTYFEFATSEKARNYHYEMTGAIKIGEINADDAVNLEKANCCYYELAGESGTYYILSRIENTFIFCILKNSDQDAVKTQLTELDYVLT